jgi:hypothetical protein
MRRQQYKVRWMIYWTILLGACNLTTGPAPDATTSPTSTPTTAAVVNTPMIAPSPTEHSVLVATAEPGTLVLDFVALMCSAQWSNSALYLPCPGDENAVSAGYIGRVETPTLSSGQVVQAPALLTVPTREGTGRGIFGRYASFMVQPGDIFYATLACQQGEGACEVAFSLHYYNEAGVFQTQPLGEWTFSSAEGDPSMAATPVQVPLSALGGQTVEFVLTVREEGDSQDDRALWILPHIQRDPSAPLITPASTESASQFGIVPTPSGSGTGVISGMVDMSSAPPYLNDPITTGGKGVPVVVVFYNLDDGTWWWVHTTATHPAYQMTVTTGRYHVVAYAHGVADVPYVAGAYTGDNPSCGQPMATVTVARNEHIQGIDIADWNWTCGGTAFRHEKPSDIPIP